MSTPLQTTDRLAVETGRILADLAARVRKLEGGSRATQLPKSSITDGYIPILDAQNNVKMVLGRQTDGGYTLRYVSGGTVPVPAMPTIRNAQHAYVVGWNEAFQSGTRTSDFERVDVIEHEDPSFDPNSPEAEQYIVGSIYRRGALPIPSDLGKKYVWFVGVNQAQQRSLASPMAEADPLPATELGAGVVTALQLAATIALVTELVCGDVGGNYITIGEDGIFGYSSEEGDFWFALNANDATGTFTGETRTALEGARIVLNPLGDDPDTMRFYPSDGSNDYASITGLTTPDGQAGILIEANSIRGDDMAGSLVLLPESARLGFANYESDEVESEWFAEEGYARGRGPVVDLIADHRFTQPDGNHRVAILHYDASGNIIQNSLLQFEIFGGANELCMYNPRSPNDMSILWGSHRFFLCQGFAGASRADIEYRTAFPTSSIEAKKDFRERSDESLLSVLSAIPMLYKYKDDDDGLDHFGPMAEDLPPHLTHVSRMGNRVVDHLSMTGELWAGLRDLFVVTFEAVQRIDSNTDRIDAALSNLTPGLASRVKKLEEENASLKAQLSEVSTKLDKLASHPAITKLLASK
jgi:hypothetical protein